MKDILLNALFVGYWTLVIMAILKLARYVLRLTEENEIVRRFEDELLR